MKRIALVLLAVGALTGLAAYNAPVSGQIDGDAALISGGKLLRIIEIGG